MRFAKNVFSQLHTFILWALISVIFWGWVFTRLTDAPADKKLTLYIDAPCDDRALALALEDRRPEGIRMVQVHPFGYAMFDESELRNADLYLVSGDAASNYVNSFIPLNEEISAGVPDIWRQEGETYGVRASEELMSYVDLKAPGAGPGPYYLFFGVNSHHAAALTGRGDNAALTLAEELRVREDDSFLRGVDVSSVIALEQSGVIYRDEGGTARDLFSLLAENGVNAVRVRVWNDPYDEEGRGYGGGNCDVEKAAEIARRAAGAGLRTIVDFHYSDFWADPGKQMAPKAWVGMGIDEKEDALYHFTVESLQTITAAGGDVAMVQVGNETNGALCGEMGEESLCRLLSAGARAVREVCPEAKVAVHFTNPERAGSFAWYAGVLDRYGVDYDVFAGSYYPFWHGTLDNLASVLGGIHEMYGKDVMVMETSYAYTDQDTDHFPNTISAQSRVDNPWPHTPEGQAEALRAVFDTVRAIPGGIGVVYWEGAWIRVPGESREACAALWEEYGSGWASSYAGSYDPDDAGRWYGGCAVDNQALFSADGFPLPALRVFSEAAGN